MKKRTKKSNGYDCSILCNEEDLKETLETIKKAHNSLNDAFKEVEEMQK